MALDLSWEQVLGLFNCKRIESITGFKDGLIIRTADKKKFPQYFCCSYNPVMIKNLFGISYGLDDIINTHIGRKCESSEQAEIWFMAKVLGSKK